MLSYVCKNLYQHHRNINIRDGGILGVAYYCCFCKKKMYYCQKNWCKFYSAKSSPHGHCQRETAARASLTGVDRFMTRNRRPRSKSNYQTGPHPSCLLVVDRLNSGSVLFLTGSGPLEVQRACHAWLGGLATTGLHQAALHLLP